MFLQELSLTNIRSYEKQKITFKKGITLLAGDIGSGKTTILIALEFALFGILRGKTSPAELLRHGESNGSVTLKCQLQGKEVTITRALRRRGSTISQLPGELTIDGATQELVPTELKARILELMGYPDTLLSKSTNLFRYTVYTPQEQVKHILHESVDERKDVIRKIFQIDKYQTVAENTALYVGDLRERIAHLSGQLDDLKTLEEQKLSQENELEIVEQQLPVLLKNNTVATAKVLAKEKEQQELQTQITAQQALRNKSLVLQKELTHTTSLSQLQEERVRAIAKQLETQEPLAKTLFKLEDLNKVTQLLHKAREKKQKVVQRLGELAGKRGTFTDTCIQSLTICPTCKQEVTAEHKHAVEKKQQESTVAIDKQIKQFEELLLVIKEKETSFQEKITVLQKEQQQAAVFAAQQKQRALLEKEHTTVKETLAKTKLTLITKEKECQLLEVQVAALPAIDTTKVQQVLQELRFATQQSQRELTTMQTRLSIAKKTLTLLTTTITQKKLVATKAKRLTVLRSWLQELFTPLVKVMEKRVLLRVYQEFQSYFAQWFSLLISDEELSVSLDEDFTPLVQQHGFDTTITNLSGGEKTGVALAYRLALNKVLNDYFSSLHTKGLLILDEPTDGFSSEQIDRLRDVFEQIAVKQLILVSHEPRLESVADQVIRVEKQHHQSLIR